MVVVVGHIDHGKSTLLDFVRHSNVVAREAGGITQRLGAYEVEREAEGVRRRVTFIDTPGHEAFRAARTRGASAADVAILLVSAEDGVKPQTLEALKSIRDAQIPFVVAINKIDSPKADAMKTKQTLADAEVFVEGYGGDVAVAEISAKTGQGVPELLDLVLLTADLAGLTADLAAPASGFVLEATKDRAKGVAATLVLKDGTLRKGSFVAASGAVAPVRRIEDCYGKTVETALPGQPVSVIGWDAVPAAGSVFSTHKTKAEAEAAAKALAEADAKRAPIAAALGADQGSLGVVIRADFLGSVDAIEHELRKLASDRVRPIILARDTGDISEADVKRAATTPGSVVVGFNVRVDRQATALAERDGVAVRVFDVIYDLVDWLAELAKERTPRRTTEVVRGELSVVRVFGESKGAQVVGGRVLQGEINVGDEIKLLRRGEEIAKGRVKVLQKQKLPAESVREGDECGLAVDCRLEIAPADRIVAVTVVED